LGIPLSFIYSRISSFLLHNHLLDSSLSKVNCSYCYLVASFHHLLLINNNLIYIYCRCPLLRCSVFSWYLLDLLLTSF
jgi:hypothetical protein